MGGGCVRVGREGGLSDGGLQCCRLGRRRRRRRVGPGGRTREGTASASASAAAL